MPEAGGLRRELVAAKDLLLQPIDVVVDEKRADRDRAGEQERAGKEHEVDERRQCRVNGSMKQAAGMAVGPFVQILMRRLQVEIGKRVLDHEHGNGGKGDESEVLHRRYFDRASAAPSQFAGGGFVRK